MLACSCLVLLLSMIVVKIMLLPRYHHYQNLQHQLVLRSKQQQLQQQQRNAIAASNRQLRSLQAEQKRYLWQGGDQAVMNKIHALASQWQQLSVNVEDHHFFITAQASAEKFLLVLPHFMATLNTFYLDDLSIEAKQDSAMYQFHLRLSPLAATTINNHVSWSEVLDFFDQKDWVFSSSGINSIIMVGFFHADNQRYALVKNRKGHVSQIKIGQQLGRERARVVKLNDKMICLQATAKDYSLPLYHPLDNIKRHNDHDKGANASKK